MVRFFVIYDISEHDVRRDLRETLKNWGGTWLQYSVFELDLPKDKIKTLIKVVKKILRKGTGDIRFVFPCKSCYGKIEHISTRISDLMEWDII